MENNPNSDQNPEQLMSDHKKSSNDDHDHDHQQYYQLATISSQSSSARSYECSFCKRGFTNAQALGGHMNIHRKDKAKLKQLANFSSHETKQQQQQQQQITLEINPKNIMPIKPGLYSSPNLPIVMSDSNLEESDSTAIIPSDVATTTSWFLNQEPTSDHDHHHHDHHHRDQMGLLSSSDGRRSQSDPELDLELRLGPEPPQDSSSTAVATRKFF